MEVVGWCFRSYFILTGWISCSVSFPQLAGLSGISPDDCTFPSVSRCVIALFNLSGCEFDLLDTIARPFIYCSFIFLNSNSFFKFSPHFNFLHDTLHKKCMKLPVQVGYLPLVFILLFLHLLCPPLISIPFIFSPLCPHVSSPPPLWESMCLHPCSGWQETSISLREIKKQNPPRFRFFLFITGLLLKPLVRNSWGCHPASTAQRGQLQLEASFRLRLEIEHRKCLEARSRKLEYGESLSFTHSLPTYGSIWRCQLQSFLIKKIRW